MLSHRGRIFPFSIPKELEPFPSFQWMKCSDLWQNCTSPGSRVSYTHCLLGQLRQICSWQRCYTQLSLQSSVLDQGKCALKLQGQQCTESGPQCVLQLGNCTAAGQLYCSWATVLQLGNCIAAGQQCVFIPVCSLRFSSMVNGEGYRLCCRYSTTVVRWMAALLNLLAMCYSCILDSSKVALQKQL